MLSDWSHWTTTEASSNGEYDFSDWVMKNEYEIGMDLSKGTIMLYTSEFGNVMAYSILQAIGYVEALQFKSHWKLFQYSA